MDEAGIKKAADGFAYWSTKTYNHSVGLSCCFRQWRARSHCRFLHGYAIEVKLIFSAKQLDLTNWVVDFGGLKSFKTILEAKFDHKTLVAEDDPLMSSFQEMHNRGLCDIVFVPATGCEAMARMIFEDAQIWLEGNYSNGRVILDAVEVSEHEGNSAIYGRCVDTIERKKRVEEHLGS